MGDKNFIRGAGILLPVTSLPSSYGIGTMGEEAYRFIDLLVELRQRYWHVLPIGPTSFGDSPYLSFSAFAGNPYLIDLDDLVSDGLLKLEEIRNIDWGENLESIDYSLIFNNRFFVLKKAFERFNIEDDEFIEFKKENEYWLNDYALFMALKNFFNNKAWNEWDEEYKNRKLDILDKFEKDNEDEIVFWKFCQFKFFSQWAKLRSYADSRGIEIIGDMPLYIAFDSADVWANTDKFLLDENHNPTLVAGCPPDAFSATGQKWGNPIYKWDEMEKDNFEWWSKRLEANSKLFHIFRINQFVSIVRYYGIPYKNVDATKGKWYKGPGKKMADVIENSIGNSRIIPEDLGVFIPGARKLIGKKGWPQMKILQFAFDNGSEEEYLPHNYNSTNIVVYGGTHDNDTLVGHFQKKTNEELQFVFDYLGVSTREEIPDGIIRLGYSSIADIVIYQMQDILKLDNTTRMNQPTTVGMNWRWRMWKDSFTDERKEWIRKLSIVYRR